MRSEVGLAMRAPDWTEEQRQAIDRRDGELFLDAAAGSGKTSVLVERFVQAVLQDGVGVDRILAITFTEKAAGELRERIRRRLLELAAREAARATEAAYISTIHALCARLLRAHALEAGIDPAFVVLDEVGAARLSRRAFDEALEELAQTGGERAQQLIASYGITELRAAIVMIYDQLRSRGERDPRLPEIPPAPELAPLLERLRAAATRALAELDREGDRSPRVRSMIELLERAAALAPAGVPWPGDLRALQLPGGNGGALRGRACLEYAVALTELRDACAHLLAVDARETLERLLRAYGARYEERKRQLSGLDFEDLELLCRDLLRSDPELRERCRARFERVMVDELQDTNAVQLELIDSLTRANLFTVGDAQQSIYAFRHADVTLFERRGERLAGVGARATLRVNFRSRPEILEVINRAFGPLLGGRFAALEAGRSEPWQSEPRVELLVVDRGAEGAGETNAGDLRAAEAELLAGRIRELLDVGVSPADVVVLVRATTDIRTYERALECRAVPTYVVGGRGYWSHPQVLDMVAYLRVLANPRDEEALYTVLVSPLVGVSYDALVLIAAAAREQSRDPWSVLQRAAEVTSRDPGRRASSPNLEDAVRRGDGGAALPPGIGGAALPPGIGVQEGSRLLDFVRWVDEERRAAAGRGIQELIERVLDRTGYHRAVLGLPDGPRRLANIRKLMRLGREHGAASGPDLRGFLDLIAERSRSDGGEHESEAPLESEAVQAVRLMTIHRAKGLEFPVVCVADLGRSPRRGGELLRVSATGRLGLRLARPGTGAREPALAYEQLGEEQRRAHDAEERRLFYVAATRARERLIFSGAADVAAVWGGRPGTAPIGWLGPALLPDLPEGASVGEVLGVRFQIVAPAEAIPAPGSPAPHPRSSPPGSGVVRGSPASGFGAMAQPRRPQTSTAQSPHPSTATAQPRRPQTATAQSPHPSAPTTLGSLSYTGLALYTRCPYRFYVERVLGLPPIESGREVAEGGGGAELGARERGTIVHALLAELDFRRPLVPAPAAIAAAAGRPVSERECAEIRRLIAGFASGQLCMRLGRARTVRREQPFGFLLGRTMITGVLDVIAYEPRRGPGQPSHTLVIDYKTDRLGDGSPEEAVRAAYRLQRLIYALASLRDGAEEVEVAHVFLERPDQPAVARCTQADAAGHERELARLVDLIHAGVFPVSDRPHRELCAGCPAEGGLCSWPLSATRGAPPRGDPSPWWASSP